VQDVSLSTALLQAYHTLLMVGRYPLAVLFLEMPAEEVDVNVHPTKAEVKFREPDVVFRVVQNAVRRALLAHTPVPELGTSLYWKTGDWQSQPKSEAFPGETQITTPAQQPTWNQNHPGSQSVLPPTQTRIPLLRLVGQVASAFLVAEGPDGLYLIDQHAAHERVLFEKMMLAILQPDAGSEGVTAQALLEPQTVNFPAAQASLLTEQLNHLAKIGFRVEEFGRNTFIVRAIPVLLSGIDPAVALQSLVEDFEEDETPLQKEIEAKLVARICKRAAVKAGQSLSPQEQRALLADLEACTSPRTCPHGRPTMIHLSVDLLERQFGRRGAR
jgi:DNA mismatch repair protein MutL